MGQHNPGKSTGPDVAQLVEQPIRHRSFLQSRRLMKFSELRNRGMHESYATPACLSGRHCEGDIAGQLSFSDFRLGLPIDPCISGYCLRGFYRSA
jgi:hypothetical protein